jgi:polysaccharide biosynthesis protein PslH
MKLIVLSPFVYYPGVPHGGGALCWGQLEGLAAQHEIHFVAFAQTRSAELAAALPHLQRICASVTTVHQPLDKLTILRAKLAQLWLTPVGASICDVPAVRTALQQTIERTQADAVLVQFPQMAQYVATCGGVPTLMDVQDAYSVSAYRQYKAAGSFIKRLQGFLNWLGWLRYESRWYARFSAVAAITEQDRLGLEVFSPGLAATTSPAAVAIPAQAWVPVPTKKIAFIGSFTHQPNVAALFFFIHQVLPHVLQAHPDAVFEVAGKGVPHALQVLGNKNIQFVGMVPDAYDFVRSAAVVVVPLLSGGGIKIKTLEAMACGCPIVTTSIGAEETGAGSGEQMLIADTPHQFAQNVIALLDNPGLGQQLGTNARALARQHFSWQAKWASLNRLLKLAVDRHKEMTTPPTEGQQA